MERDMKYLIGFIQQTGKNVTFQTAMVLTTNRIKSAEDLRSIENDLVKEQAADKTKILSFQSLSPWWKFWE